MNLSRQLAPIALAIGLFCLLGASAPASGEGTPSTYILIAADEALPAELAQQVAARDGSIIYALPEIGVAIATSADASFAADASSIAGLRSVVPDVTIGQEPETTAVVGNPPTSGDDDRFFDMQWALDAIDAPEAWAAGARGAGARVAVLDTGIDVDHPDLAPNLNLALSRSFIPGLPVAAPPTGPPSFTAPPHHGTWVAGIIAAADNGIGTIGVAPEAELVALRVCPDSGRGCPDSAILPALVYAGEIDADVINLSLGGWLPRRGFVDANGTYVTAADVAELIVARTRALDFAHHRGATIVAATHNQARDLDADKDGVQLSAQLPHVIAVAATGPRGWGSDPTTNLDLPACYSNYGQSVVDLAAPGGNVDCNQPFPPPPPYTFCKVVIALPCFAFDTVVGPTINGWTVSFGTSASAPHVAGVAALVIGAHGGHMNPDTVEAILRASADDLGKPGLDDHYGSGRVNAVRAVSLR
ncbi:MAG TPA: S8 family serine peptidase [Solirubrobacterales bacterium]|nr:S8 family serine peptidase [Solirubrobacterales bacterium]